MAIDVDAARKLTPSKVMRSENPREEADDAGDASAAARIDNDASADDGAMSAEDAVATGDSTAPVARRTGSDVRLALMVGLSLVLTLGVLAGWLGLRAQEAHQSQELRQLFVQVGRQAALNLTTIDHAQADADVKRILDSATGAFYDDFSERAQPFIDVVKQAKSKSVGTVTAAGLESESGESARVLVAVSVKTSNDGAPEGEGEPRSWRMLVSVQKVADQVKVADVDFVP